MQQGDVKLFQTNDDGDIIVEGGIVEMSGGLETAAYLALFGGNEDDAGGSDTTLEYWGNKGETQKALKYRSETQHLLRSIPAIPANLLRIKDAAKRDLSFFVTEKIASSVSVVVTMPGLNKVKIVVLISAIGNESEFEFIENWKAAT